MGVAGLFSVVLAAVFAQGQGASTVGTYVVGTCKPTLPTFSTITAALAATPAPTTVQVCPGTYYEQIEITQPVTLQGINSGSSGQAVLAVPSGDLTVQTTDADGNIRFPQLWVNNAGGTVNVADLTVDGTGSTQFLLTGIFFQNTPGTLNHLTLRNQSHAFSAAIVVEGGGASPSVTVENSVLHDFDNLGIFATSAAGLTATIKSNDVSMNVGAARGLGISAEAGNVTINANYVSGGVTGIFISSPVVTGSVTNNVTVKNGIGISTSADGVSVTGNKILDSTTFGIAEGTYTATIKSNVIMHAPYAIDVGCLPSTGTASNTIIDANVGVLDVPSGGAANNFYYSVGALSSNGVCPSSR
jgi:hypothetical protein